MNKMQQIQVTIAIIAIVYFVSLIFMQWYVSFINKMKQQHATNKKVAKWTPETANAMMVASYIPVINSGSALMWFACLLIGFIFVRKTKTNP